jgi:hypothetical protein
LIPLLDFKPKWLKKRFASSRVVFCGVMPQKQGAVQFIGFCKRGSSVNLAFLGSKVPTGVCVAVGGIAVTVGDGDGVFVLVGVNVSVGISVAVAEGIADAPGAGCFSGLAGIHPTRAKAAIMISGNKVNGFNLSSSLIV